jgi:hypothetical protein
MVSLSFTSTMLDEGTIFVFGSWIGIANGLGGFKSHLADSRKPETSAATRSSSLNELPLPDLPRQIEKMSIFNATWRRTWITSTRFETREPTRVGSSLFLTTTLTQTKSTHQLQFQAEEDSRTGAPPLVGRPQFSTTTRIPMITPSHFRLIIRVRTYNLRRKVISCTGRV